jgi:hypothetical protein
LSDNRIEANGGGGISLPGPERVDEVFRWNSFGTLPREQAVRVLAANPAVTPAPAAAAGTPPVPGRPR